MDEVDDLPWVGVLANDCFHIDTHQTFSILLHAKRIDPSQASLATPHFICTVALANTTICAVREAPQRFRLEQGQAGMYRISRAPPALHPSDPRSAYK